MYKVVIKHKDDEIASTELSSTELDKFRDIGLSFILEFFEERFGINIGQYGLNEYEQFAGISILKIRTEDLIKLRNYKLETIGI